ncbi:uncharacterized protein FOMMEDRAFT_136840 [Fomitiporia mediterranea MF3/22]|uniref:uncharacterized protein n=1 Tax=Fomitiporia mediterranea (strain MF3/22) TaxID=694068 RepID=UPI0004408336|nr:uncharacterized protein FOMMEDRAFT_136840 [Fomitiporia mediterranea MF3/22]EJC98609.1 hypothetical protein FOMMEDRAFT_136840 [Fomitiporia mediterranea MF3/22]
MDSSLLSPSLAFDLRSPDDDLPSHLTLASPPSSPLMVSPLSPSLSPRVSFASQSLLKTQFGTYSSYLTQHSPDALSPGPGSATSSDDSRSPVDNSLDVDFDNMADFEYTYPLSFHGVGNTAFGGGDAYNHSQASVNDRKQRPIEINSTDGESISVASPYIFGNGELPYISGHLKQEYYTPPNVSDMSAYNYMGVASPDHASAQTYAYTSSPESSFIDGTAYYSPPAPVHATAPIPISAHSQQHSPTYPMPGHAGHSGHIASTSAGQGGCDPRFVSGSPPDLDYRSRIAPGSGPNPTGFSPVRFAGAFGSADADTDADADADGEVDLKDGDDLIEDASGEEERTDDDGGDSDYIDGRRRLRPRASLVVPSQAARVTALTTPVVGSSVATAVSSSPRDGSPSTVIRVQRPSAPAPVPVPNLTKKSRGRRVPTHPGIVVQSDGAPRRTRGYTCRVSGCGKCFARGEHLKRHIRSIHTNEKPHKCPHPGCGKEFSRHDNLCQHMRVHRNFSAPRDGGLPAM